MKNYPMSRLDYQRLSEQIGYAKNDTNISGRQLVNLIRRVREATLFDPADIPADVVTMNSKISVVSLDNPKTLTIQLVYPEQANAASHQISILTPLATALLGCREKELIGLPTPYGTVRFCIERILYQPEAAGDLTL